MIASRGRRARVIVDRARVRAALPGYEIGPELGHGGYGLVLAGRHRRLARPVAIKILAPEATEDGLARFAGEAQILAGLDHPHVVRVHDYVEAGGLCLIVMEQLPGGTIAASRERTTSAEAACAIGLAVAEGLGCAHAVGVLHRDVKPSNVLLARDGTPKVTDFGVAKMFTGSGSIASGVIGTGLYMAPEQWRGGRLEPATDLYALGVTLYELLTGRRPFGRRLSPEALLHHHLNVVPPPPHGVPGPVAAVLLRALAKDPRLRQPTARVFAVDLAHAAAAAFGPGWLVRAGVPLQLDGEVRDAARALSPPTGPTPRPAGQPPTFPSAAVTPSGAAAGPSGTEGPSGSEPSATARGARRHAAAAPGNDQGRSRGSSRTRSGRRRRGFRIGTAAVVVAVGTAAGTFVLLPDHENPAGSAAADSDPAAYSGPPVHAGLGQPNDVAVDSAGNLYVTNDDTALVQKIAPDGQISVVAGTGVRGYSGDGGPATAARISEVEGIVPDTLGGLYIADSENHRIRYIAPDGRISTVAGNGDPTSSGDGGLATDAALYKPAGIALDADGNLYIADAGNNRVLRRGTEGRISTVAGLGEERFAGDGGLAIEAALHTPTGVAFDDAGNLYIADAENDRIRRVGTDRSISTVVGNGGRGSSGDQGPAVQAQLYRPTRLTFDDTGNLYFTDGSNGRVRRVGTDRQITTVAGTGEPGFFGDGGEATRAHLTAPVGLTFDGAGNLYIADSFNNRIRRVDPDGQISTVVD